ncbi:MAG: hypothetical protein QOG71_3868 [Pyrinomonadaceae bacterium]|nr:hypothetical protein [Pyrinomonadaceae bacterium]
MQRIRSVFEDLSDASGTYNFTSAGDFLANAPSRFRQRFGAESAQQSTYAGVFFQHEWQPARRLTLTAGLRYELESVLPDRDNFGPASASRSTRRGRARPSSVSARTLYRFFFTEPFRASRASSPGIRSHLAAPSEVTTIS